jgi:hypothetical protein
VPDSTAFTNVSRHFRTDQDATVVDPADRVTGGAAPRLSMAYYPPEVLTVNHLS